MGNGYGSSKPAVTTSFSSVRCLQDCHICAWSLNEARRHRHSLSGGMPCLGNDRAGPCLLPSLRLCNPSKHNEVLRALIDRMHCVGVNLSLSLQTRRAARLQGYPTQYAWEPLTKDVDGRPCQVLISRLPSSLISYTPLPANAALKVSTSLHRPPLNLRRPPAFWPASIYSRSILLQVFLRPGRRRRGMDVQRDLEG